jgi:hypothetical protein
MQALLLDQESRWITMTWESLSWQKCILCIAWKNLKFIYHFSSCGCQLQINTACIEAHNLQYCAPAKNMAQTSEEFGFSRFLKKCPHRPPGPRIILLSLCSRNSAPWQWHSAPLKYTEFCLKWRFPWHHVKCKCFRSAACVDSSLQLGISAETIPTDSYFKLPSEYTTWILPLFFTSAWARCQLGSLLWPLTSLFWTIAAHVPFSSLYTIIKIRDKGWLQVY